jgi:hypothetical protein
MLIRPASAGRYGEDCQTRTAPHHSLREPPRDSGVDRLGHTTGQPEKERSRQCRDSSLDRSSRLREETTETAETTTRTKPYSCTDGSRTELIRACQNALVWAAGHSHNRAKKRRNHGVAWPYWSLPLYPVPRTKRRRLGTRQAARQPSPTETRLSPE